MSAPRYQSCATSGALLLALTGLAALAVAIGVGRFAFTPLLPLMQIDAGLTLTQGGWLASANYLGYLVGALTAARTTVAPETQLRSGLMLVIASTMFMGITANWPEWIVWRFVAGVASAWVLVSTSSLCLARLARLGEPQRAGIVFAGVGTGIAVAGLLCLVLGKAQVSSSIAWWLLALAALAGVVPAWFLTRDQPVQHTAGGSLPPGATQPSVDGSLPTASRTRVPDLRDQRRLVICYGLFGFGYILPATFLPAQAQLLFPDPGVFGWAWPAFGIAAAGSTLLASSFTYSRRRIWAISQWVMAMGVLLPLLWSSIAAIVAAAICVGGTFMVITMIGMQEARAVAGTKAQPLMAAMTAAFAAGQLAGPLVVSAAGTLLASHLELGLGLAAAGLVLSNVLLHSSSHRRSEAAG